MTASTESSSQVPPPKHRLPVIVGVLVLGLGLYSARTASQGAEQTTQLSRAASLQACRSSYSASAGTQLGVVLTVNGDLGKHTTNATRAAIEQGVGSAAYAEAAAKLDPSQRAVDDALAKLGVLQRAYEDAVERSFDDPDKFLRDCERTK